jgi:hypothetical protein
MAALIPITKAILIERIKRHISNDLPSSEFSTSDNEILLYIDQAVAAALVGQVYNAAKVEGTLVMPEAYLTTYALPSLTQDTTTHEWYSTLPQPPVSLPLGYSLDYVYFANSTNGKGLSVFLISASRVGFREDMPMPFGVRAWVEGSRINFVTSNGASLLNQTCYVRMAATRTSSLTDTVNIPDDALELIFNNVVAKLKDRIQLPQNIIQDDLPSGNKAS